MQVRSGPTQMRWWAVIMLLWPLRETLEPARYAVTYTASWASRVALSSGLPMWFFASYFITAAALVATLIAGLVFIPDSRFTRSAERFAGFGLAMAAVGYAYLTYLIAVRDIDAPHVVDTYAGAAALLMLSAWPIGCWANERALLRFRTTGYPPLSEEAHKCDAPVR